MPTIRQRKLAKAIIENSTAEKPKNKQELVVSSGYSPASAKSSSHLILEQEGVQEALNDYGFNPDNAKQVVAEILLDSETDKNTRLNAAKEVFKVFGEYAPEKKIVGSFNLNDEHREKARNAIKNIAG